MLKKKYKFFLIINKMSNTEFRTHNSLPLRLHDQPPSLYTSLASNPPFIDGKSLGGSTATVPAAVYPVLTDGSFPWMIGSIISNGQIADETATTPGQFRVSVGGIYKIILSLTVAVGGAGGFVSPASFQDLLTVNGSFVSNASITFGSEPGIDSYVTDLHGETYLRLNAGDTVNLAVNAFIVTAIPLHQYSNQEFAIQWIAP